MIQIENSFVFPADTTVAISTGLYENGVITMYTMVVPAMTAVGVTATLSIADDDAVTIYTGDAKNENGTYVVTGLTIPCNRGYTATVTLNKEAGAGGGTVTVKLFLEERK